MYWLNLFCFALLMGSVALEPFEIPCDVNDSVCLAKNFLETSAVIASGIPELGIESLDPLFLEYMRGELPVLDFEFYNSTLTGLKECKFRETSINEDVSMLRMVYDCPGIKLAGKYKFTASAFSIESRGNYFMETGRYIVTVDTSLGQVTSSRGTNHLQLGKFKVKCELLGVLDLVIKSTDSTSILIENMANKYIKENYKTVALHTQDSVWTAIIKKHLDRLNKYFMTKHIDEILVIN